MAKGKEAPRDQAWARLEIWERLYTQLDSVMEGILEENEGFFDASDHRRLAKAKDQVNLQLLRKLDKMRRTRKRKSR